jgi:nicotinamidase-related amidase
VREHDPSGRDAELFRRHHYSNGKGPTMKGAKGAELVDGLKIREGDYKLIKMRFSAFFNTHLDVLLKGSGIKRLVVVGMQLSFICIMFHADMSRPNIVVYLPYFDDTQILGLIFHKNGQSGILYYFFKKRKTLRHLLFHWSGEILGVMHSNADMTANDIITLLNCPTFVCSPGVQTPNCIRQTVFDAVALDYEHVTVIVDATAAATPEIHSCELLYFTTCH